MRKILLILMLGIFLVSLASADSIGKKIINEDLLLFQKCNNCTYCNFTIVEYIPTSTILVSNVQATKNTTYYYYILDKGNITNIGAYRYCYDCGNSVDVLTGCLDFKVTSSRLEASTSDAILYTLSTLIFTAFFIIILYFAIVLPGGNPRGEENEITGVNNLKYLKILSIAFTYPLLILILNFLNGLAVNYSTLSMFSGIIGFIFLVMMKLAWLWTLLMIIWIVYWIIKDSNFKKLLRDIQDPLPDI